MHNDEGDAVSRFDVLLARVLERQDRMVEVFTDRVLAEPGYVGGSVTRDDIRRSAVASIGGIVRLATDRPTPRTVRAELEAFATGLGTRRARGGMPLDALMTAIRLDFSVIWAELADVAEPEDAALLVDRAERVWFAVDGYAATVREAYTAELERMASEASSIRQDLVAAAFGPEASTTAGRERIRDGLGVDAAAPFLVAAATAEHAPALREVVANGERHGAGALVHYVPEGMLVAWRIDDRAGAAFARVRERLEAAPCGIAEAPDGISGIALAAQTAMLLASLHTGAGRALTVDADWARLVRHAASRIGLDVGGAIERGLEPARGTERDVLVETVHAYLASGSVAAVASALYCHRNTVQNRLRRFAQLTGVDVTVPAEAARVVVAWR